MQFWAFYRLFRRWLWAILALALCVSGATVAASLVQPRSYEAKTVIYLSVEASQETSVAGTRLESVREPDRRAFVASLGELIHTRSVWELASQAGVSVRLEDYQKRLSFVPVGGGELVELTWKDATDSGAVDAVNAIAEAFIGFYKAFYSMDATHTREVLEAQLQTAEDELNQTAEALKQCQARRRLMGDKDIEAVRSSHTGLQASQRELEAQLSKAQSKAAALSSELARVPKEQTTGKTYAPSAELTALRTARATAEAQMAELRAKYNPSHPRVIELQATLDRLARDIYAAEGKEESSQQTAPHPLRQQLESQLADAKAEAQSLAAQLAQTNAQLGQLESQLAGLPEVSYELSELARKKDLAEATYQRLAQACEEARISEESAKQKVRMRVVEPASLPLEAKSRRTVPKAILAFIATIFVTTVAFMLLEQTDNRVKGPSDVQRLVGVRPLVSIPLLSQAGGHADAAAESLEVRAFHEAFRSLRSQLFSVPGDPPPRVVGLMSARSGDGRTTVAVNLAETIAHAGETVLLVDANLRAPEIHGLYGLDNGLGLASVLAGTASLETALQPTGVSGLSLLPAGPVPEDPSLLLRESTLFEVMARLRERFGWVIVDTPPGLAYVDAILMASALDEALLVVASGAIVRGAEARLLDDLEAAGVSTLGAVVNRVLPQYADALHFFRVADSASRTQPAQPADTDAE